MIRHKLLLITALLLGLISCNETSSTTKHLQEEPIETVKIIEKDTNSLEIEESYYFKVVGDFDGDKQIDTLNEQFLVDGKNVNKQFKNLAYDQQVATLMERNATAILEGKGFEKLELGTNSFGLLLIENVGDLDGDGKDEIGLALDYADFSNLNSYFIYSYSNNAWVKRLQTNLHETFFVNIKDGIVTKDSITNQWKIKDYDFEMGEFIEKDTVLSPL